MHQTVSGQSGIGDVSALSRLLMGPVIRVFQYIRKLYPDMGRGENKRFENSDPMSGAVAFEQITVSHVAPVPSILSLY